MHSPLHTDIAQASGLISNELQQVKKLIEEQFADAGSPADRLLETFGKGGGKMIRPAMVLLSGSACGKVTDEHIYVAAVIEIIHNATLLHDDVIDDGLKRRGLPTVNSLWGNEAAVLLGDFLLCKVFSMCAGLEPQVVEIIADAITRTCRGELSQIMQRQNWRLGEQEYIEIITDKTAALFSSCGLLGALLAGAGKKEQEVLTRFGRDIGIAFQITDDLLDIVGDEKDTGKTGGSDVDKNKITLPVINLLENTAENRKDEMIKKLITARDSKRAFAKILKSNGSLEYAYGRAKEYVSGATKALLSLRDNSAKEALSKTANFITERVAL
jgi:octaprenyl-diphosphate synthase